MPAPSTLGRLRDWFLLLFCNLIWASQFAVVKLVQRQLGPVFTTFFPMALAMGLLIPIVHRRQRGRASAGVVPWKMPLADGAQFVLIGVLGQVVAQLFITWGVRLSLASNAALLALTLPVATAVMAYFVLGERMSRLRWISFALAIAGVVQCSGINWSELNFTHRRFLAGNVLIFLSVNGSAFYNTYSKKMLHRYSPLEVLLYSYYAVFVFLLPITLYTEGGTFLRIREFTPEVWVGLAILAVFQYSLSMVIFLDVLSRLDATQAALCNYLIPFFGLVIAWIVLGERMTGAMVAGGLLVLASTLLVTVYEERREGTAGTDGATGQDRSEKTR